MVSVVMLLRITILVMMLLMVMVTPVMMLPMWTSVVRPFADDRPDPITG